MYRYQFGNVTYGEADTDSDGLPDLRLHYSFGVLKSTEHVGATSGRIARLEKYQLGRLVSAEADTDNDGRMDTQYRYGKTGAVEQTERIDGPTSP